MTRAAGRNDRCPCGSGRKHKHCCAKKTGGTSVTQRIVFSLVAIVLIGGLVLAFSTREHRAQPSGVWSAEHNHYH